MKKELNLSVDPEVGTNIAALRAQVANKLGIAEKKLTHLEILRRSIDARRRPIRMQLRVMAYVGTAYEETPITLSDYQDVHEAEPILIVGLGPAGLFAALRCLERGYMPIVLERGKDVRERIQDLRGINTKHTVNSDSNYCFGEGGAGTYSDGKLYTRSKKRGDVSAVLQTLVGFGATPEIMVDAHPHIGTNKLPPIIKAMRERILAHGGQILFNTKVTELLIKDGEIQGVKTAGGEQLHAKKVILATGHSARDIFEMLHRQDVAIELKPIAVGVRVEHSQGLIDQIQYKLPDRGPHLPPSSYSIVKQINGRGVYSFCMCPGGVIAPCATSPGEVVTNGWSSSERSRSTANSGMVVELRPEDFALFADRGPLAAMTFQQKIEQAAWKLGGESQAVPAQRLGDFVQGVLSADLPKTSYAPGITSADVGKVFPEFLYKTLQKGFVEIGKTMRGYMTNDAVVHAPETRTSSPVRIPRDRETLEHIDIKGLYPCGEGAGYAGGIVSAAIDGTRCADKATGA
ncbi:MAG: NAD(P)/FAD-dependent oxidoreductase [Anaerolineae bacterium]